MTLPVDVCVTEVCQVLQSPVSDLILLDCRTDHERRMSRIEPSLHIPMDEIAQRVHELDHCRSNRIVVYCHLGGRSRLVTEWLRGQGIVNAQNMAGGIDAWSVQVDPSIPRYH